MISPKQIASRLGVSLSLVYSWLDSGSLPHYRFGRKGRRGRIMVDESELDGFVAGMKAEGRKEPPPPAPRPKPVALQNLKLS